MESYRPRRIVAGEKGGRWPGPDTGPAATTHPPDGTIGTMSSDVAVVFLFALAGFLIGGAYTTWKTARPLAIALGVCAVLAAVGAVVWLI